MKCRVNRDTPRNIPRSITFFRYISCYIAESRLPLGQCAVEADGTVREQYRSGFIYARSKSKSKSSFFRLFWQSEQK